MKILIISDSHDNVVNLEKVLAWAKENGVEALIHAGDLSAPSILGKVIAPNFSGSIHLVLGNVGDSILTKVVADKFSQVKYYGEQGEFELAGKKIALAHEPAKAEPLINSGKYDLVIYGHTHQAEVKTVGPTLVVNPGTLGGLFAPATFAVYNTDTGAAEIKEVK